MRRRAFLEALPLTAHLLRRAQLNDASLWSPCATDSSILIVGNSLRPLLAAVSLSPAKFAYLSHTMGVCLAALAPLSSWVGIQIGYSISDFISKCVVGFMVTRIAMIKSAAAKDGDVPLLTGVQAY